MRKGIAAAFFTMVFLIMLGLLPTMYNFCGNKMLMFGFYFLLLIL